MSLISRFSQSLDAAQDLTALPFQLTREFIGDDDSLTGRFLKRASHIGQAAITMPIQMTKNLLDEPGDKKSADEKKERLMHWSDDSTDKFEELGRS